MKLTYATALLCVSACVVHSRPAPSLSRLTSRNVHITESMERAWVTQSDGSRLIDFAGNDRLGTTLTIHGMNAAPDDVAALSRAAQLRGERVLTVAYDDNFRRLQDTANDFAQHIAELNVITTPNARLRIDAHSMGARAAVVAVDRLRRAGRLPRRALELQLIAPLLSGVPVAGSAWLLRLFLPFGLSQLVKNAEPARDLGPHSDFQRELESARFPAHVRVEIPRAQQDKFVRNDTTLQKLAKRWRAHVSLLAGTTHRSVLAARVRRDELTSMQVECGERRGCSVAHVF